MTMSQPPSSRSIDGIQTRNITSVLSCVSMFANLESDHLRALEQASHIQNLTRGEVLFRRGDNADAMHVVASGLIQLVIHAPEGAHKVIEIVNERQSFGEAVMLLGSPYPVAAQAMTPSSVIVVPKEAVLELLEHDSSFARQAIASMAQRLHALIAEIESLTLRNGRARVGAYLLDLHQQSISNSQSQATPRKVNDQENTIALGMSKRAIASRLNLSPEALSRILRELKEQRVIEVRRRQLHLCDLTRLREIASGTTTDPEGQKEIYGRRFN